MTDAATDTSRPAPAVPRRLSGSALAWRPLALLAAWQLAAGVLMGIAWRLWAPKTTSYLLSGADGKPAFVVPDESESQIAGDGRFVLLSVLLGIVFGALAWRVRSGRGPLPVGVLAVTGVLSSVLAMAVGELLSHGSAARTVNAAFTPQLSLHGLAALWVQAFFAVLVYTALAGLSSSPELDRPTDAPRAEASYDEISHAEASHADISHAEASHAEMSRAEASRADAAEG